MFQTGNIDLVAYLLTLNAPIIKTSVEGKSVYFHFNPDVGEIADEWLLTPTPEQKLVQDVIAKRQVVLNLIKSKRGSNVMAGIPWAGRGEAAL